MGSDKKPLPIEPPLDATKVSKVLIQAPGYEPVEKIPYKGDGTLKDDLGVIKLNPIQKGLKLDQIEATQLKTNQIELLSKDNKTFEYFTQKRLTGLVITLTGSIIPLILKHCALFNITKLSDLITDGKLNPDIIKNRATCPTQAEINKIITSKNRLTSQLNNIYKTLEITQKTLGITKGIISGLKIVYTIGAANPLPTPAAIPLALNKTKQTLDKLSVVNSGILSIVILTQQVLLQCISYLNALDQLIQNCYPESDQSDLSNELRSLSQQVTSPTPTKPDVVNGFTLSVETEDTTKSLKRRRAIAKNAQDIIMLKGEWSFSSIDQILIDELVFYIQQNNLKAY
jgi:hypothetical protein